MKNLEHLNACMPAGHRIKMHRSGRISFPSIVLYSWSHDSLGNDVPLPSPTGTYLIKVVDFPAYERLAQTNLMQHPAHVGAASAAVDNRRTS